MAMFDPTWLIPDWNCDICGSMKHETKDCPVLEFEKEEALALEHESQELETEGEMI